MGETITVLLTAQNGKMPDFQKEENMKITALYERLSSGDEGRDGDSNSIKNQKIQLETYAKSKGFGNIRLCRANDTGGFILQKSQTTKGAMPMQNQKDESTFTKTIGGSTYKVQIVFSKTSKDSFTDKLLRLVKNDATENAKAS